MYKQNTVKYLEYLGILCGNDMHHLKKLWCINSNVHVETARVGAKKKFLLVVTSDLTIIFIDQLRIFTIILDQYILKRPLSHQSHVFWAWYYARCSTKTVCNSNLLPIPVLADTTSMAKSGQYPVNPNMVVFKYLWWPAKSIRVISLVECSHISSTVLESL